MTDSITFTSTDLFGRCCTDVPPSLQPARRDNIMTVLYPGLLATMGEASKYTGPDPITVLSHTKRTLASGGCEAESASPNSSPPRSNSTAVVRAEDAPPHVIARVTCQHSPRLLHNVVPMQETFETRQGWGSYNPLYWATAGQLLLHRWFFRIPSAPLSHNAVFYNNMGGFKDQRACTERIEAAVRALVAENEKAGAEGKRRKHLVLFGFSRGATTMLYACLRLRPEVAKHISLLVLEAPFDTLDNLLKDSMPFPSAVRKFFTTFGDDSGEEAYTMPPATSLACPIAFVTSHGDYRVPTRCSDRCVATLQATYPGVYGAPPSSSSSALPPSGGGEVTIGRVERLYLKRSNHHLMSIGDEEDRASYIKFMERLYDTYCS